MESAACAQCGAAGAAFFCGRCRRVSFCNAACQRASWPLHKKECKEPDPSELAVAAPKLRSIPITELKRMPIKGTIELLKASSSLAPDTTHAACRILASAAQKQPLVVARAGGVAASIAAMKAHPSNADVVVEASSCLSVLAAINGIYAEYDPRSLAVVASTLHAYAANALVCEYLCTVIASVADEDECGKEAACAATLPLVVKLLGDHAGEPGTVVGALSALCLFIVGRPRSRADAVAAGATPAVLRILFRYAGSRDDAGTRFRVCNVLRGLTADRENGQADVVVDAGAIPVLLGVLRETASLEVVTAAAGTISNTFIGRGAGAALLAADGVPVIVEALRRHARDEPLAICLVNILYILVRPSERAEAVVVLAGAIPVLIEALRIHATGSAQITSHLCGCLACIACPCHGGSWAAAITAGGTAVKLAEAASRRFATINPGAAAAAKRLLANISTISERP